MEIEVVAGIRMQIGHKRLRVLVKSSSRFIKDAIAFTVTDDVVIPSCNGKGWSCEVACICSQKYCQ
jgi:hypothetical protein